MTNRIQLDGQQVWEVISAGGVVLCSRQMKLTRQQAENVVENNQRIGYACSAHRARKELPPAPYPLWDYDDD